MQSGWPTGSAAAAWSAGLWTDRAGVDAGRARSPAGGQLAALAPLPEADGAAVAAGLADELSFDPDEELLEEAVSEAVALLRLSVR